MTPLRRRMIEELQLRNLSTTTFLTYIRSFERLAKHFGKSPETLGAEHVRDYLLHLRNVRKVQTNTILVIRRALRFLYVNTLRQTWFDDGYLCRNVGVVFVGLRVAAACRRRRGTLVA